MACPFILFMSPFIIKNFKYWWSVIGLFFFYGYCHLCLRTCCLPPSHRIISYKFFFQQLCSFKFYVLVCYETWMKFCVGCEVEIEIHVLQSGYLVVAVPFVKRGIVSPHWITLTPWMDISKWNFMIHDQTCVCTLDFIFCFTGLMSILMPISHDLGITYSNSSNFVVVFSTF